MELREAIDLFCGVIRESRSGVDAILGETCREQDCEGLGREVHHIQEQVKQQVRPKLGCMAHLLCIL